ncbi:hypothetical protein Zmor_024684 [Zophobas morio]|uniref:Uncharacterized protein n=1 Tax=Zophobas morio TaxID=2755281 RepID=A0AA38M886_9CUCU|nr:hypothetical protein Zmor_024684 [Zophobas morio]
MKQNKEIKLSVQLTWFILLVDFLRHWQTNYLPKIGQILVTCLRKLYLFKKFETSSLHQYNFQRKSLSTLVIILLTSSDVGKWQILPK